MFLIDGKSFGLPVWPMRTPNLWSLVPLKASPLEIFVKSIFGPGHDTLLHEMSEMRVESGWILTHLVCVF